jgi:hypothetical protein
MRILNMLFSAHQLLKNKIFESNIRSPEIDSGLLFKCGSKEWISYLELCNGIVDCEDASDERNCHKKALAKGVVN